MNADVAIDLFKSTLLFALYLVMPFLLAMLVVGVLASLFQSITSVQEATLTFAPKLFAFAVLSLLLTPWVLRSLTEFTVATFARMPGLAH
jgi:flagellar biosynthetic protein FliQ